MVDKKTSGKDKSTSALLCILSFAIPFFVIVLAYIGLHITPFGDKTILVSDARILYTSDLSYISRALRGQENLFYSFEQGIGLNLMGTHSGLLNPANIIVLLFDITALPAMYSWLMAIDTAFCGLTMFIFLSAVYGRKSFNLIFSTVYALIGFNVAYCFHYNFLLSVELLPLIALGIKRIIAGQSPWLYLIALAYGIFASFYFGYMLCIASIVLFLMWYTEKRPGLAPVQKKRTWINYAVASLVAGLLVAIIWVPTFLSFSGGRADQNSILDFTLAENMSFADMFAKLFIGANNTSELVNGQPNIFCGALVVFLAFAFFLDRRNNKRTKLNRAIPLAFYCVTFYVKALSMVMQGFTDTNWFNYRYSFVFSFLLIVVAFEEFQQLRTIDARDFKRACTVFLIFVAAVFFQRYSFVDGGWMLVDLIILACCLGAIWWNRVDEVRAPQRVLAMLLVLMCAIEGYANYMVSTNQLLDWAFTEKAYQDDLFNGSVLAESVTKFDPGFYRMVNEHPTLARCNNDPRLFGYNGVNYFGSCERTFVFRGMSRLGMSWWSNRMWYAEGEPEAFDSLLGVKYVVSQRDLAAEKDYAPITGVRGYTIYKNNLALPIGLLASDQVNTVTLGRNPFENHNNLWKAMTGRNADVFDQEQDIHFTYHANNDGETVDYREAQQYSTSVSGLLEVSASAGTSTSEISSSDSGSEKQSTDEIIDSGSYIECTFIARQNGSVYAYYGAGVEDNSGYSVEAMHYLGEFRMGDVVKDYIAVTNNMTLDFLKRGCAEYYAAYVNDATLSEYCQLLQARAGTLEKETDSHLVGAFEAGENDRLFFTIPYDEGWTLKVDGIEAPLEVTADLFMSSPIQGGRHTYELTFFPKGMKTGLKISCGAVVLLLLLMIYNGIIRRDERNAVQSHR